MPEKTKKFFIFLFSIIFIFGVFSVGFFWGKFSCKFCPPEEIDFSLFWEVYYKLKEKFVDKSKIDPQKILYGAISGMVNSLGDPYTVFLTPEETKRFQEDIKGSFEGVGMEIGLRKGRLQVIAPLEGTPAKKAGLKAGDWILEINGISTEKMTIEEAVNLIRGPKGTKVKLTILREGWENPKQFEIIRDVISVPSLKWEMKDGIIYIRIYHFTEKASLDFAKAAVEILSQPSNKIILDLRNNPGGYLEVATEITGWFLEKDKIVAIEDFGNGLKREYKSQGPAKFANYKIVTLINKGTASGAEILAGALKDNLGIILIGEKSFGKGSVQQLENLRGGSALKVTIARWLTPKGNLISEVGLDPDIKVETDNNNETENEKDVVLEKAIEILKNF